MAPRALALLALLAPALAGCLAPEPGPGEPLAPTAGPVGAPAGDLAADPWVCATPLAAVLDAPASFDPLAVHCFAPAVVLEAATERVALAHRAGRALLATDDGRTLEARIEGPDGRAWWQLGTPEAGMRVAVEARVAEGPEGPFLDVARWVDDPAARPLAPAWDLHEVTRGVPGEGAHGWVRFATVLGTFGAEDGDTHVELGTPCPAAELTAEVTPPLRALTGDPQPGAHVAVYGQVRWDDVHGWWEVHPIREVRSLGQEALASHLLHRCGTTEGQGAGVPDRAFFVTDLREPALAALAPGVAAGRPAGLHWAPGADPRTEARIVWYTDACAGCAPEVRYGRDPWQLTDRAAAATTPAPGWPLAAVHAAALEGLEPGTTYHYRVGDAALGVWSDVHALRTAPAAPQPLRFVALADHGTDVNPRPDPAGQFGVHAEPVQDSPATWSHRRVAALRPDLVLAAGDVTYGNAYTQFNWPRYFDQGRGWMPQVPLLAVAGNHEEEPLWGWEAHAAWFALPEGPEGAWYYSLDWGNVHLVGLHSSAESDEDAEVQQPFAREAQRAWLAADLAAARAREGIDWVVVWLHHAPFSSNGAHGSDLGVRGAFGPLFDAHGVDLVIAGHDHFAERTRPVRSDGSVAQEGDGPYVAPGAPVYVVTGGGGAALYRGLEEPAPAWSAWRAVAYEVLDVQVWGKRLVARFVASEDGAELHRFEMRKP